MAQKILKNLLGLKQTIILTFIIYIILVVIGVTCSINGAYTSLFLSNENNNK